MSDISVVITFYNQDYNKLFQSLYSIICQNNIDFDIVITDDGSDNFDKNRIEKWFNNYSFHNFTIIANRKNQGTVLNTLVGWENAKAKYVKMLSPGDFLYDSNVLYNLVEYINHLDADICFGKIAPYRITRDGKIEIINLSQPKDLSPYTNYDKKQIQKNYLIKKDYPCGMSFAGKRELMIRYIKKIAGKAKFFEDCTYILMVADGLNIRFWNNEVIWYEVGDGISTSGSQKGNKRAFEANRTTYNIIRKENPEWKEAYKPYNKSIVRIFKTLLKYPYYKFFGSRKDEISFDVIDNYSYDIDILKNIINMT